MSIKTTSWGVGYSVFQVMQGLLLHPYQTMRQVVRERVFLWLVWLPVVLWILALFVWRLAAFLFVRVLPYPNIWVFVAVWFTVGIGMYQALLLYLWFRFMRVVR